MSDNKPLITDSNFHESAKTCFRAYRPGDDFYQHLIDAHRDLSDAQSQKLNARLILLLANHIGDLAVLREAIAAAAEDLGED
ncbi:MAG: DUF2783 domain-containing protein [Gammaproteobacteria bacterium]|nr:DUF2783 domain-containing protein [Gammaproteobacteria bacterium]